MWRILGVSWHTKSSTNVIFSARSSGSECEHINRKGQHSFQTLGNGDSLLVTNYNWNSAVYLIHPCNFFHFTACLFNSTHLIFKHLTIATSHKRDFMSPFCHSSFFTEVPVFLHIYNAPTLYLSLPYGHYHVTEVPKQPTNLHIPCYKNRRNICDRKNYR